MTIATLTGHACLAVGEPYSIVMDNGPAARMDVAKQLQYSGHVMGDFFEVSTIRKEDYNFHKGKSEYEDVLQANNLPSSRTPRGHQAPAAFIILASGLDKHGIDGKVALPFSHLDIAAGSGPFPGVPSSSPVLALARYYMPQFFQWETWNISHSAAVRVSPRQFLRDVFHSAVSSFYFFFPVSFWFV